MDIKEIRLALASGSPRRIDMLAADGVNFEIVKPSCSEEIITKLSPARTAMALALRKNLSACAVLKLGNEKGSGLEDFDLLLSADTVVALQEELIGKPRDEEDAACILRELSGRVHIVYTGVCIYEPKSGRREVFCDSSEVHFKNYDDDVISEYIASGEPMDKAGAYAIQGGFGKYIEKVEGNVDTVIGFPYGRIKEIIKNW